MKKLTYIIAFVAFGTLLSFQSVNDEPEAEINWMTLEEAIELQKETPKKIIMDVYTNWCGPCKMLDKYTFHNEDVVNYINEHYYAVKFNAEGIDVVTFKGNTYSNPNYNPELAKLIFDEYYRYEPVLNEALTTFMIEMDKNLNHD